MGFIFKALFRVAVLGMIVASVTNCSGQPTNKTSSDQSLVLTETPESVYPQVKPPSERRTYLVLDSKGNPVKKNDGGILQLYAVRITDPGGQNRSSQPGIAFQTNIIFSSSFTGDEIQEKISKGETVRYSDLSILQRQEVCSSFINTPADPYFQTKCD